MQMWPVLGTGSNITVDLVQWGAGLGGGGFAEAFSSAANPDHVLKRMHEEVAQTNAIGKMKQLSAHARAMGTRLDGILATPPSPWVGRVCRSLRDTLTTHIGYSNEDKRVYLYQRRAIGASVRDLLARDVPRWRDRVQMAKNFAAAMVALGRCNVVHLDCSPDNVFVEPGDRFNVTLIDLDGCGVLADNEAGNRRDAWAIAPMTLGRPDETRPIWFPHNPEWQTPLAGSFKFAERWCVINEVWRILSWGSTALFWLDETYNDLFLGYQNVADMFRERSSHLSGKGAVLDGNAKKGLLTSCQHEVGQQVEGLWTRALNVGIDPEYVGQGPLPALDQEFLVEFARLTLLAFLSPRNTRFVQDDRELRGEMPNAKWIQDRLIHLNRPTRR
jgi:hypothetical protein